MVGEASGRMQKADCRDEIALPAAMLAWLKYRKQRTRNSRKRFLVFFCSLFVKARVVYRLRAYPESLKNKKHRLYIFTKSPLHHLRQKGGSHKTSNIFLPEQTRQLFRLSLILHQQYKHSSACPS